MSPFPSTGRISRRLEGLLPFLNPGGVKRVFASLIQLPDATLRVVGLAGMLAGLLLLWFVRG